MTTLLKNGNVFLDGAFRKSDLILKGDKLFVFDSSQACSKDLDSVIELDNKFILPGFADVHVHFREPGFSYKETIKSGSMAAARQVTIDPKIFEYLLNHWRRDMDSLMQMLDTLDNYAVTMGKRITLPLLRQLLKQQETQ